MTTAGEGPATSAPPSLPTGATVSSADYFVTFDKRVYACAVEQDPTDAEAAVNTIDGVVAVKAGAGPWTVTMSKDNLVAGTLSDAAFTTIGFQTDGKTVKFKIITKMPGEKTADSNDPYGEAEFSSIKWYYGTLVLRPERLAIIKTVAAQ